MTDKSQTPDLTITPHRAALDVLALLFFHLGHGVLVLVLNILQRFRQFGRIL
jgi:hypothetical protein